MRQACETGRERKDSHPPQILFDNIEGLLKDYNLERFWESHQVKEVRCSEMSEIANTVGPLTFVLCSQDLLTLTNFHLISSCNCSKLISSKTSPFCIRSIMISIYSILRVRLDSYYSNLPIINTFIPNFR